MNLQNYFLLNQFFITLSTFIVYSIEMRELVAFCNSGIRNDSNDCNDNDDDDKAYEVSFRFDAQIQFSVVNKTSL